MAAKLTRPTHKIAIQLYLVAETCTICSSRSRRPVRKLLDTPSCTSVFQRDPVISTDPSLQDEQWTAPARQSLQAIVWV